MSTRNFSNRRFKTRPSGRPAFKRGGSSSGFGGRKKNTGEYINPALFINKSVITEEVEHFVPEHNFQDFNVNLAVKKAIASKGYITPTPIQDRAITHVLSGSDVVGIANTGTGKTAAFLIPLINKVVLNQREMVLIVVPTRELALQIEDELRGFTKGMSPERSREGSQRASTSYGMRIFSVCCVGGASIGRQISQLRGNYNFIIGTPGRLKDLIERRCIRLADFRTIVLDEADRMLDMGFINDMRFVMAGMPKERQTLFFSATLSRDIDNLIHEFLHEPVRISVKTRDTAKNVEQDVVKVDGRDKMEVLHNLLMHSDFSKVLIFGRTKHGVERLSQTLTRRGFKSESIHGNKNQSQRQRALNLFKASHIQILVATDVAARGLDIADVSHVINYDLPGTYDDYVHRIGRTGRAEKRGKALTFLD